ncbi:MAG: DUF4862 family protein [Proteobacteria bacterium]|nr:MAG: DUF4862 family protein [Pseudomonadota bacterium]
MNQWFLGAYAGYANLPSAQKTPKSEALYREGLLQLPFIRGLELPFYEDIHETDSNSQINSLPKSWDYIITTLPGTMNALAQNTLYGLASPDDSGREAALNRLKRVKQRVNEIHNNHGRKSIQAIEVHSAPRGNIASQDSLRRSLETLLTWNWDGVQLILEHCDAWHADGEFSKGFLTLQSELATIGNLPIHVGLNWGRSVLEGRRTETIHRHIELAGRKLKSLFFSGTAISDPLYGTWQDNHAAIRLDSSEVWESTGSLLTQEAIEDCKEFIQQPDLLLGLKVQPFPTTLTIDQRLSFLKQQLEAVNAAYISA